MRENARPDVAAEVLNYLNQVGISVMQWPPKCPDLNSIEKVWERLKKYVKRQIPASRNPRKLENAIIIAWVQILKISSIKHA